jgi:hypothetical protein
VQIPMFKSESEVLTIKWIIYVPGFSSMTPLVILMLFYYIEAQWLINVCYMPGTEVAYN